MCLCRAASLERGRGALAQPHTEPTKYIYRFYEIPLLPSYENILVVITTKLHLLNLDNVCVVLTTNSWWQLYLHEDMLQVSKVIFSNQGLFAKCIHIKNWFPLVLLFITGLIVLMYGHSKWFPLDFYTEAICNSNLKKSQLTYPWCLVKCGLRRNQNGSHGSEIFKSGIKRSCLINMQRHEEQNYKIKVGIGLK